MTMVVGITGHRPLALNGKIDEYIKDQIYNAFIELTPHGMVTGLSLGIEQWGAEIALKLGIPYIVVIPFEGQDKIWNDKCRDHYYSLLDNAVKVINVSNSNEPNPSYLIMKNNWIVNNCNTLIAVFNHNNGITEKVIASAKSKDKRIYYINPDEALR